jgi:hypothetical protein
VHDGMIHMPARAPGESSPIREVGSCRLLLPGRPAFTDSCVANSPFHQSRRVATVQPNRAKSGTTFDSTSGLFQLPVYSSNPYSLPILI